MSNLLGICGLALAVLDIYFKRQAEALEAWLDHLPNVLDESMAGFVAGVASLAGSVARTLAPYAGAVDYPAPLPTEAYVPHPWRTLFTLFGQAAAFGGGLFALVWLLGFPSEFPVFALAILAVGIVYVGAFAIAALVLGVALFLRVLISSLNAITRGNALAAIGLTLALVEFLV